VSWTRLSSQFNEIWTTTARGRDPPRLLLIVDSR